MSAFVVEDKTINRIVSFLVFDRDGDWPRKVIKDETGCDLSTHEGQKALGQAMFDLNCHAVNQRYGEGDAERFRPLDYAYRLENASRMQVYKSLGCWLYQCCEGDVPDTSLLYATMSRVKHLLADAIVCSLPEYDKCGWN